MNKRLKEHYKVTGEKKVYRKQKLLCVYDGQLKVKPVVIQNFGGACKCTGYTELWRSMEVYKLYRTLQEHGIVQVIQNYRSMQVYRLYRTLEEHASVQVVQNIGGAWKLN